MDPIGTGSRRTLRLTQGVAFAFLAAFSLHAIFWRGSALEGFFNDWVYNGLVIGAAVSCLLRAVRVKVDRSPWMLLGVALGLWAGAEITNTLYLSKLEYPPYPS